MSRKIIARVLPAALLMAAAHLFNASDAAAVVPWRPLNQTGCGLCCPACDHVCNFKAEQVDEEKTCFDVESKVICIPRVVFPWQNRKSCDSCDGTGCQNCIHHGARTRRICVLKTEKYKCPKCEYSWSAEKKPCAADCDVAGCDATMPTPYESSQPMVYRELSSAEQPPTTAAKGAVVNRLPAPVQ